MIIVLLYKEGVWGVRVGVRLIQVDPALVIIIVMGVPRDALDTR